MECDGGWGSDGGGGVMEKEVMGEGGVIYALATISMATYHRQRTRPQLMCCALACGTRCPLISGAQKTIRMMENKARMYGFLVDYKLESC